MNSSSQKYIDKKIYTWKSQKSYLFTFCKENISFHYFWAYDLSYNNYKCKSFSVYLSMYSFHKYVPTDKYTHKPFKRFPSALVPMFCLQWEGRVAVKYRIVLTITPITITSYRLLMGKFLLFMDLTITLTSLAHSLGVTLHLCQHRFQSR